MEQVTIPEAMLPSSALMKVRNVGKSIMRSLDVVSNARSGWNVPTPRTSMVVCDACAMKHFLMGVELSSVEKRCQFQVIGEVVDMGVLVFEYL